MTTEAQVSAIVPARNEEANIAAAVESLAAQTVPLEIIVVNDGSTDRTAEILSRLQQRLPQLRVVEVDEPPPGWTGKSHAVVSGIRRASTPWLLLSDADVCHLPKAVEMGLETALRMDAAVVSFSPDQELSTWWERAIIPYVYCRLAREYPYERVSNPRDPVAAANGQWLLVSRRAYSEVGGHGAVKDEVLEDVALARLFKQAGCRLHFSRGVGVARTQMYRRLGEMWEGWSKNLFPLLGRRKSAVVGAVAGAMLDTLAWLSLPLAGGSLWRGWPAAPWLLLFGLAILSWRHLRYAQALRENRYPLGCIFYHTLGSFLFAALLVGSAAKYLSGEPLKWKGRQYVVPIK
jgi:glycosyltransferase involved in cell wall biosynthesis